ncbi:hypothetical protein TrVE_jg9726 [Triparma verrucosa]|uniref:Uncharacterized protein n=1 Tax=Triparma verrucosa TaxID=1606542 RepID=A0A9W7CC10_9STRA|nr:hypothetical protein TrVE_jg9726 [Triparma verrucosa]
MSEEHISFQYIPRFWNPPPPPPPAVSVQAKQDAGDNPPSPLVRSASASSINAGDPPVLIRGSSTNSSGGGSSGAAEKENSSPQTPQTPPENPLQARVRQIAKAKFLAAKESSLLNFEELAAVESLLNKSGQRDNVNSTEPVMLTYEDFCALRPQVPKRALRYMSPAFFLSFNPDSSGHISATAFFKRLCSSICIAKTRITLQFYDQSNRGTLRETDVENYIFNLIPDLPPLANMSTAFHPFYVFTATRRFMFFLDPKRTGSIPIKRLVTSSIMEELLELGMEGKEASTNWFSSENSLRVYSQYLELDKDQNGLLSKTELQNYTGSDRQPVRLTPAFIDRIFDEITTYQTSTNPNEKKGTGEMDYKTFLDFVLAMENKKSKEGLRYFWRLLSFGKDYLDSFAINYFFRDIVQILSDNNIEAARLSDVKDEIFDMVKPQDQLRITLNDLIRSGCGDTVVEMLIDINGFWAYDNRESLVYDDDEEEGGGENESPS